MLNVIDSVPVIAAVILSKKGYGDNSIAAACATGLRGDGMYYVYGTD
jgi:hypothetical protein